MVKPVLLTVDDDRDVLSAIARDLRKHYGQEYRVLRTDSGSGALELLQKLKDQREPVALVLSDQRMPAMDGVTLLAETIKLHPKSKRALTIDDIRAPSTLNPLPKNPSELSPVHSMNSQQNGLL